MPGITVLQGCRTIPLSRGLVTLIDEGDYALAARFNWNAAKVGRARDKSYAQSSDGRKKTSLHRYLSGSEGHLQVDHRNGDTLDNRRENLRPCTPTENSRNKRKAWGISRYKGVCWCKQKSRWKASLKVGLIRFQRYLPDEESAARAYDELAIKHFGEFAATNAQMFNDPSIAPIAR